VAIWLVTITCMISCGLLPWSDLVKKIEGSTAPGTYSALIYRCGFADLQFHPMPVSCCSTHFKRALENLTAYMSMILLRAERSIEGCRK
jgi:hypothetical protein